MALVALPVFMNLSDELIMTCYWYLCNLQPYIIPILVNTALKHSSLLQNIGWPGRIWRGWTRNMSLIALQGFMHLSDELWWLFIGIHIIYNHGKLCFWSHQRQKESRSMASIAVRTVFAGPFFIYFNFECALRGWCHKETWWGRGTGFILDHSSNPRQESPSETQLFWCKNRWNWLYQNGWKWSVLSK